MDNQKTKEKSVIIYTHKHVDFDAIGSTILLSYFLQLDKEVIIKFTSLYEDIEPPDESIEKVYFTDLTPPSPPENSIIIDHHNESDITQKKTATSKVYDYLYNNFPEYREKLVYWKKIVNESIVQDYLHDISQDKSRISMRDLIAGFRILGYTDEKMVEVFSEILKGIVFAEEKKSKQKEKFYMQKGKIESICGYKIAYYNGEGINTYLFQEEKCDFVIYKSDNGIGIIRNAERTEPSLVSLKSVVEKRVGEEIEEWFFHPGGFYAGRGGLSHPVSSSSIISLEELVEIVKNWLCRS